MARDRKRSRPRREKPVREPQSARGRLPRGDLPASLDHTGEVDEFDAALLRGARGVPAESDAAAQETAFDQATAGVETVPAKRRPSGNGSSQGTLDAETAVAVRRPSQPMGTRVAAFLRASWAELQRVQWPDRRQVTQATAVVLGFVAVMGAYLGVADWAAQKIVNFIL